MYLVTWVTNEAPFGYWSSESLWPKAFFDQWRPILTNFNQDFVKSVWFFQIWKIALTIFQVFHHAGAPRLVMNTVLSYSRTFLNLISGVYSYASFEHDRKNIFWHAHYKELLATEKIARRTNVNQSYLMLLNWQPIWLAKVHIPMEIQTLSTCHNVFQVYLPDFII